MSKVCFAVLVPGRQLIQKICWANNLFAFQPKFSFFFIFADVENSVKRQIKISVKSKLVSSLAVILIFKLVWVLLEKIQLYKTTHHWSSSSNVPEPCMLLRVANSLLSQDLKLCFSDTKFTKAPYTKKYTRFFLDTKWDTEQYQILSHTKIFWWY